MSNDLIAMAMFTLIMCVALGGAAFVAAKGQKGWGWLIFAAMVILSATKISIA